MNAERETPIHIWQIKYLNNIVEQDHRAIKRITRQMASLRDFRYVRIILASIKLMHMIRNGQMKRDSVERGVADQFYSLVT